MSDATPAPRPAPSPAADAMKRALRLGYLLALVALPVAVGLGALVAGVEGVWGALAGLAVPVAFLSMTTVVALLTARMDPMYLGAAILGSWLLKIVVLIVVLALLRAWDGYSKGVFLVTFAIGLIGYLAVEALVVLKARVPYVDDPA